MSSISGLGTKSKASYFLSRNTLNTVRDNGSLHPTTRHMAGNSLGQLGHIILTSSPPNGIYYSRVLILRWDKFSGLVRYLPWEFSQYSH